MVLDPQEPLDVFLEVPDVCRGQGVGGMGKRGWGWGDGEGAISKLKIQNDTTYNFYAFSLEGLGFRV